MEIVKLDRTAIMIIDTETGKHMTGAKGQDFFGDESSARRSLVHTGWWQQYRADQVTIKIGRKGLLDELRATEREIHRLNKEGKSDDRRKLITANTEAKVAIMKAKKDYNKNNPRVNAFGNSATATLLNEVKFKTQTRYVLKKVVAIQVEDL